MHNYTRKDSNAADGIAMDDIFILAFHEHFQHQPNMASLYVVETTPIVLKWLQSAYPQSFFVLKGKAYAVTKKTTVYVRIDFAFNDVKTLCEVVVDEASGPLEAISWHIFLKRGKNGKWIIVDRKLGTMA
jgi:hypothetical protein